MLAAGLTAMLAISGWSQVPPRVQGTGMMPSDGILVLRTGQVLRGKITHAGDLYYVVLPNGEIRISSAKVDFACSTLEEAYTRKRAGIRVGNAQDHIELGDWCQQQGLLGAAARELADARAADPANPMIPYLERRLKMNLEPAPARVAAAKTADSGPSLEELDRMTRSMPPGALEVFTTTIQPLLLNHCTAADCHGGRATGEFRLLRSGQGRTPSRRLTQRNLYVTLKLLDRDQPEASPLLTVPIHPHGTASKEIFADKNVLQYRQMVEWVYQVTGGDSPPAQPATVARRDAVPVQAMSGVAPGDRRSIAPRQPVGPNSPLGSDCPFDSPPDAASLGPAPPRAATSKVHRGASLPKSAPVDPFDPEIFNRQFSPSE
ncbi:MAG: hypothetical protein NTW96_17045 [Planctomycetia bacterium]|nr:hypothetical protein [Planctomycetia bacterium]